MIPRRMQLVADKFERRLNRMQSPPESPQRRVQQQQPHSALLVACVFVPALRSLLVWCDVSVTALLPGPSGSGRSHLAWHGSRSRAQLCTSDSPVACLCQPVSGGLQCMYIT